MHIFPLALALLVSPAPAVSAHLVQPRECESVLLGDCLARPTRGRIDGRDVAIAKLVGGAESNAESLQVFERIPGGEGVRSFPVIGTDGPNASNLSWFFCGERLYVSDMITDTRKGEGATIFISVRKFGLSESRLSLERSQRFPATTTPGQICSALSR